MAKQPAKRPVRVVAGTGAFLLQFENREFLLRRLPDGRPSLTPYPSRAFHGSYSELDLLGQQFEAAGFGVSTITDIFARPVGADRLGDIKRAEDEARAKRFWPE